MCQRILSKYPLEASFVIHEVIYEVTTFLSRKHFYCIWICHSRLKLTTLCQGHNTYVKQNMMFTYERLRNFTQEIEKDFSSTNLTLLDELI